jgi:DNA-binding MarR family transcriptional regulator
VADYDHTLIDDVIHSRLRLAVMAVLASLERVEFTVLRDRVKATDGNLSTHLRKLEEAGYVQLEKHFVERKPRTDCSLTKAGRSAFRAYVDQLGQLVAVTANKSATEK